MYLFQLVSCMALAVATGQWSVEMGRFDIEGEMLIRIIQIRDDKMSMSDRGQFFQNLEEEFGYPSAFLEALEQVMLNGAHEDFETGLRYLVHESVIGAELECGLCFSILGAISAISPHLITRNEWHVLETIVPDYLHAEHAEVSDLLFAAGMELASTVGTLALYSRAVSRGESNRTLCDNFSETLMQIGRDAASDDVLSELIPPTQVDFKSRKHPRSFISPDMLETDSEGLGYYIHMMKENAASLSTAMMFGGLDVLEFAFDDKAIDMDEVYRSAEQFGTLDEEAIALDLISSINTARYNLSAMRFNKAMENISSTESNVCAHGVALMASLGTSQSLLVKALFFQMNFAFFSLRDSRRAIFFGLLAAEIGDPVSFANVRNLFPMSNNGSYFGVSNGDVIAFMQWDGDSVECKGEPIFSNTHSSVDCLNMCMESSQCLFAAVDETTENCAHYSVCDPADWDVVESTVYYRATLEPEHNCLYNYKTGKGCIENLHVKAAKVHGDLESMHWLMYFYAENGKLSESLKWATVASHSGDPEATYQLALLVGTTWGNHPANTTQSLSIFWKMLNDPHTELDELDPIFAELDVMDRMELEMMSEIAEKLGIHDLSIHEKKIVKGPSIVQRSAGLIGILTVYSNKYWFIFSRIMTLLALIPALFVLLRRRIR